MRIGTVERTIGGVGDDATVVGRAAGRLGVAPVYRRLLELRDAGLPDEAIAVTLDVAVEAVPALLDVAARKCARQASPVAQARTSHPPSPSAASNDKGSS